MISGVPKEGCHAALDFCKCARLDVGILRWESRASAGWPFTYAPPGAELFEGLSGGSCAMNSGEIGAKDEDLAGL